MSTLQRSYNDVSNTAGYAAVTMARPGQGFGSIAKAIMPGSAVSAL